MDFLWILADDKKLGAGYMTAAQPPSLSPRAKPYCWCFDEAAHHPSLNVQAPRQLRFMRMLIAYIIK